MVQLNEQGDYSECVCVCVCVCIVCVCTVCVGVLRYILHIPGRAAYLQ